jgi:hypothetical protein
MTIEVNAIALASGGAAGSGGAGTIYVGTQGGGVYQGAKEGDSLIPYNGGLRDNYVRALVIEPMSPRTVYAGTRNAPSVFKSTDAGVSWLEFSNNLPMQSAAVSALIAHPQNPGTIYAACDAGVYRTVDGGINWIGMSVGLTDLHVQALIMDPTSSLVLYAATPTRVFRSADAGNSWAPVATPLPTPSVLSLLVNPAAPNVIYAGTAGGGTFVMAQ